MVPGGIWTGDSCTRQTINPPNKMDIHQRAEQLARESRGRLTVSEARRELGRRGARARHAKKPKNAPTKPVVYWWQD